MCINCWIESGSPAIVNEKVTRAAELIKALYDTEDGGVGGYGHIVFDDFNIEDHDIEFCLGKAATAEYSKDVCEETRLASIAALEHFKTLTEDERSSALAFEAGYLSELS